MYLYSFDRFRWIPALCMRSGGDVYAAVGASEEVVAAAVGALDGAVLE